MLSGATFRSSAFGGGMDEHADKAVKMMTIFTRCVMAFPSLVMSHIYGSRQIIANTGAKICTGMMHSDIQGDNPTTGGIA